MIFGVVLRVIGSIFEENSSLPDFAKKRGLTPWDFGQNFKFAKTLCIGKRRREMMFGFIFQSDWKKFGRKFVFSRFCPKRVD